MIAALIAVPLLAAVLAVFLAWSDSLARRADRKDTERQARDRRKAVR